MENLILLLAYLLVMALVCTHVWAYNRGYARGLLPGGLPKMKNIPPPPEIFINEAGPDDVKYFTVLKASDQSYTGDPSHSYISVPRFMVKECYLPTPHCLLCDDPAHCTCPKNGYCANFLAQAKKDYIDLKIKEENESYPNKSI